MKGILRFAQNDKQSAQNDSVETFFNKLLNLSQEPQG